MFDIFSYRIIRRRVRRAPRRSRNRRDYAARKESARKLALERLEHFVQIYAGFDPSNKEAMRYARVSIRTTTTRWGSCSSRKNLNFNYRILDLSPELRDYVIVHELCHLKELHHRKEFWDLMELVIPHARTLHTQVRTLKLP